MPEINRTYAWLTGYSESRNWQHYSLPIKIHVNSYVLNEGATGFSNRGNSVGQFQMSSGLQVSRKDITAFTRHYRRFAHGRFATEASAVGLKCSAESCRGGDLIYPYGECRYFINYIHWTSDVGRACVSSRRDVSRHARHEGNRIPPPLLRARSLSPPLSFSLSLPEYLDDNARHSAWYASFWMTRMTRACTK